MRRQVDEGPWTGQHIRIVLEDHGFELKDGGEPDSFSIFEHSDGRIVPINPSWEFKTGDAIFDTLRRDLDADKSTLTSQLRSAKDQINP